MPRFNGLKLPLAPAHIEDKVAIMKNARKFYILDRIVELVKTDGL